MGSLTQVELVPQVVDRLAGLLHPIGRIVLQHVTVSFEDIAFYRQEYELAIPKTCTRKGNEIVPSCLVLEWSRFGTATYLIETLATIFKQHPFKGKSVFQRLYTSYKLYLIKTISRYLHLYTSLETFVIYITQPLMSNTNSRDFGMYYQTMEGVAKADALAKSSKTITRLVRHICQQCSKSLRHFIFVEQHYPPIALTRELNYAQLLANMPNLQTVFIPNLNQLYGAYGLPDYSRGQSKVWESLINIPPEKRLPNLRRLVLYEDHLAPFIVRANKNLAILLTFPSAKCVVEAVPVKIFDDFEDDGDFLDFINNPNNTGNGAVGDGTGVGMTTLRKVFPQMVEFRKYIWSSPSLMQPALRDHDVTRPVIDNLPLAPLAAAGRKLYSPFLAKFIRERVQRTQAELARAGAALGATIGFDRAYSTGPAALGSRRHRFVFDLQHYMKIFQLDISTNGASDPAVVLDGKNLSTEELRHQKQVLEHLAHSSRLLSTNAFRNHYTVHVDMELFRNFSSESNNQSRLAEALLSHWTMPYISSSFSADNCPRLRLAITWPRRRVLKELSAVSLQETALCGDDRTSRKTETVLTNKRLPQFCFDPRCVRVTLCHDLHQVSLRTSVAEVMNDTYDQKTFQTIRRTVKNVVSEIIHTAEAHRDKPTFLNSVFRCMRRIELQFRLLLKLNVMQKDYDQYGKSAATPKYADFSEFQQSLYRKVDHRVSALFQECQDMVDALWFKTISTDHAMNDDDGAHPTLATLMPNLKRIKLQMHYY